MARRPTEGRGGSSAAPTDNFEMLKITTDADKATYGFIEGIDSVQAAFTHLNTEADAGITLTNMAKVIDAANHIGVVWALVDGHKGDWTITVAPDQTIKSGDLIEIALPTREVERLNAQQRAALSNGKIHQRDLVDWAEPEAGQPMPEPSDRTGTLAFKYLRQPQRAMFTNYGIVHLGTCKRIFDYRTPGALTAVSFVQRSIADGTLSGKPRKAEGFEYISDCIRIHKAFNAGANKTEDQRVEAAQKALSPRGGERQGVSTTEANDRLLALTFHLLATTAKIGLDTPFTRMFRTVDDLYRWRDMAPYSAVDQAVLAEMTRLAGQDSSGTFASMTFPAASRLYSMPLPPKPTTKGVEQRPDDTMTDAEVEAANRLGEGSISVPAVEWWNLPAKTSTSPTVVTPTETVILTTRSQRNYATERQAMRRGREVNPNASETDQNAGQYLSAEQTALPTEEGGEMRWVWVLRARVAGGHHLRWHRHTSRSDRTDCDA